MISSVPCAPKLSSTRFGRRGRCAAYPSANVYVFSLNAGSASSWIADTCIRCAHRVPFAIAVKRSSSEAVEW